MTDGVKESLSPQMKANLITALVYVALLIVSAILLLTTQYWYLWFIIAAVCIFRIVMLLIPRNRYKCEKCQNVFTLAGGRARFMPSAEDLYGTNAKKSPKCPRCGSESVKKVRR